MELISYAGITLSILATILWSISPICFASAGRIIGAGNVNLIRLGMATPMLLVLLGFHMLFVNPHARFPDTTQSSWLMLSGFTGLVLGDAFYIGSLVMLGARRTSQLMTLAPVATVVLAWLWLNEQLGLQVLAGIMLVIFSIAFVSFMESSAGKDLREPGDLSLKGLFYGIMGAVCQGSGAVLARRAFSEGLEIDPMVATTLRVGAATLLLFLIAAPRGKLRDAFHHLKERRAFSRVLLGTICGPVVGMIFYVTALKFSAAGVVSTLTSMTPLIVIPLVAWRYQSRIRWYVILGAMLAVAGVGMICWE